MAVSRFRNWFFVFYPESAPDNWQDILIETHVPCLVSPIHDSDVDMSGNLKKAHYHVLVMYGNVKSLQQFSDDFLKPLNTQIYQVARDLGGCARYLCHLDDDKKVKYKISDILSFNGASWEEIAFTSGVEYDVIRDISKFCQDNRIYHYWDLMQYSLTVNRTWAPFVINRSVLWVSALKSLKHKHETNAQNVIDIYIKEYEKNDN